PRTCENPFPKHCSSPQQVKSETWSDTHTPQPGSPVRAKEPEGPGEGPILVAPCRRFGFAWLAWASFYWAGNPRTLPTTKWRSFSSATRGSAKFGQSFLSNPFAFSSVFLSIFITKCAFFALESC